MTENLISIIIPVYNSSQYLERLINSIMNQKYENYECLLIDDGSSDGSNDIIQSRIGNDKRFKYIYQNNNGPSSARNHGLKIANGEYIVFVDSDDYLHKDYLWYLLSSISEEYDLGVCGYYDISEYGIVEVNDFINHSSLAENVVYGTGGVLWCKIFKKSIITENKIELDENLFMSEDMIFVLEYCKHVKKWNVINKSLYYYERLNSNSISRSINETYLENYAYFYSILRKKLKDINLSCDRLNNILDQKIKDTLVMLIKKSNEKDLVIKKIYNYRFFKIYLDTYYRKNLFLFLAHRRHILCLDIICGLDNLLVSIKLKIRKFCIKLLKR